MERLIGTSPATMSSDYKVLVKTFKKFEKFLKHAKPGADQYVMEFNYQFPDYVKDNMMRAYAGVGWTVKYRYYNNITQFTIIRKDHTHE